MFMLERSVPAMPPCAVCHYTIRVLISKKYPVFFISTHYRLHCGMAEGLKYSQMIPSHPYIPLFKPGRLTREMFTPDPVKVERTFFSHSAWRVLRLPSLCHLVTIHFVFPFTLWSEPGGFCDRRRCVNKEVISER